MQYSKHFTYNLFTYHTKVHSQSFTTAAVTAFFLLQLRELKHREPES